jgi:hypothetical protein
MVVVPAKATLFESASRTGGFFPSGFNGNIK